ATPEDISRERQALQRGDNPRDVKQRLAERIVRQFHPAASAETFRSAGGGLRATEPEAVSIPGGERTVAELFLQAGLVSSKSEARRLAAQRGLALNDEVVTDVERKVSPIDGWRLRRGNHRIVRLKVS
ncbi:MAG TPA: S4 domain-containing protein, partial [Candidatus Dormibacteraeota bacterium]|nr:S4 domain-containing protein [Candidatus Dormibacteraeota bacterium]